MAILRAPSRAARTGHRRRSTAGPTSLWFLSLALALVSAAVLPPGTAAGAPVPAAHSEATRTAAETGTEVSRLADLVAQTEVRIARLEDAALAAAGEFEDAAFAAEQARTADAEAAAALAAAEAAVTEAQDTVGELARNSYITGGQLSQDLLLFDSSSPADLVERAGLTDALSDFQVDVLDDVQVVERSRTTAAEQASTATATRNRAETAAADLLEQSTRQLDQARQEVDTLSEELAEQQAQLTAARIALLGADGAQRAGQQTADAAASAQAAAAAERARAGGTTTSGEWAVPLQGSITSEFGPRWGSMHYGVDISAPMYTPIYAAGDGTVVQAGSASGFGQAVYIQHDDGDVTVYGHIETFNVSAGQRVEAGQEIAGVGSRGFSTGPHLHFEVQQGGIGGTRVDPLTWLAERGVYL